MNPKYQAAMVSILITVLSALTAVNQFTPAEVVQVFILLVTAFTTYFLPLVTGPWRAALKTGLEIIGAGLVWLYPLVVQGHITASEVIIGLLAIAKVLGTEVGVASRLDYARVA